MAEVAVRADVPVPPHPALPRAMNAELAAALEAIATVKLNEPMSAHTTFRVGGPADIYVIAESEQELLRAFVTARSHAAPVLVFGNGSNMLVGDLGVRGVAIENRYGDVSQRAEDRDSVVVRVGAGMDFPKLAQNMARAGYGDIEWAVGIPGSLGGAVVSNAGAHGWELKDILVSARIANGSGEVFVLTPAELAFSYRHSALSPGGSLHGHVVLTVDLRLKRSDPEQLLATVREHQAKRNATQPAGKNCGSVFTNPPGDYAARLIEQASLKGTRVGDAVITQVHSNFIQNLGHATASDILSLIRLAQDRVREQFGVELTPEVQFVGEFA